MKFDQSLLINYEYFFVAEKLLDAARKKHKSAKVGSAAIGNFFQFWFSPPLQIVLGLFFLDAFEMFFVLAHQHTSSSNTSKFRKGKINLSLSCRVNQAHKTPHQKKKRNNQSYYQKINLSKK